MKVNQATRISLELVTKLLSEVEPKRAVDLADELNKSREFTMQLLNKLSKAKLISSVRGPNGGFKANENTLYVTIGQIEDAVNNTKRERKIIIESYQSALIENFIFSKVNDFRSTLLSDLGRF